jgi:hypothetical protein
MLLLTWCDANSGAILMMMMMLMIMIVTMKDEALRAVLAAVVATETVGGRR